MIKRRTMDGGPVPSIGAIAAAAWVAAASASCGPSQQNIAKSLEFASYQFNTGVRWRKHRQASKRLRADLRDRYLNPAETAAETLKVSEVELVRTRVEPKRKRAVLRYRYRWYRTPARRALGLQAGLVPRRRSSVSCHQLLDVDCQPAEGWLPDH